MLLDTLDTRGGLAKIITLTTKDMRVMTYKLVTHAHRAT